MGFRRASAGTLASSRLMGLPQMYEPAARVPKGGRGRPVEYISLVVDELDIPVGRVRDTEERQPFAVRSPANSPSEQRSPAWADGFLKQSHRRLVRRPAPFSKVARDAGA